jgi:hypothetical protein
MKRIALRILVITALLLIILVKIYGDEIDAAAERILTTLTPKP